MQQHGKKPSVLVAENVVDFICRNALTTGV
jgi:hypothetical protein